MKWVRIVVALFAIISLMLHLIAGVSLFPLYMMTAKPDAPISRLYAHIVTETGPIGFIFAYTLPVLALTVFGFRFLINHKKNEN